MSEELKGILSYGGQRGPQGPTGPEGRGLNIKASQAECTKPGDAYFDEQGAMHILVELPDTWEVTVPIQGPTGEIGEAGAMGPTGDCGVYVGTTQPTDPDVYVWINPYGSESSLIGPTGPTGAMGPTGATGTGVIELSDTEGEYYYDGTVASSLKTYSWKPIKKQRVLSVIDETQSGGFIKVNSDWRANGSFGDKIGDIIEQYTKDLKYLITVIYTDSNNVQQTYSQELKVVDYHKENNVVTDIRFSWNETAGDVQVRFFNNNKEHWHGVIACLGTAIMNENVTNVNSVRIQGYYVPELTVMQ